MGGMRTTSYPIRPCLGGPSGGEKGGGTIRCVYASCHSCACVFVHVCVCVGEGGEGGGGGPSGVVGDGDHQVGMCGERVCLCVCVWGGPSGEGEGGAEGGWGWGGVPATATLPCVSPLCPISLSRPSAQCLCTTPLPHGLCPTPRCFSRGTSHEQLQQLRERMVAMCDSLAVAYGTTAKVDWRLGDQPYYPPLINDPGMVALAKKAAARYIGGGGGEAAPLLGCGSSPGRLLLRGGGDGGGRGSTPARLLLRGGGGGGRWQQP